MDEVTTIRSRFRVTMWSTLPDNSPEVMQYERVLIIKAFSKEEAVRIAEANFSFYTAVGVSRILDANYIQFLADQKEGES